MVEFEHSIKSAVKRLRQALDDDAEAPRYIQTLPRRGYRFIAPVSVEAGIESGNGRSKGVGAEVRPAPKSRWGLRAVLPGVALALAAGVGYRFRPLLPPPRVLNFNQITRDGRPKDGPLLTDGARVYFHHPPLVPGPPLQVSALGGEPVPVATTLNDDVAPFLTDISADCSEFLMYD